MMARNWTDFGRLLAGVLTLLSNLARWLRRQLHSVRRQKFVLHLIERRLFGSYKGLSLPVPLSSRQWLIS